MIWFYVMQIKWIGESLHSPGGGQKFMFDVITEIIDIKSVINYNLWRDSWHWQILGIVHKVRPTFYAFNVFLLI